MSPGRRGVNVPIASFLLPENIWLQKKREKKKGKGERKR